MKYSSYLIKPASSLCNMNCQYCFYADVSQHRNQYSKGVMNKETTDKLIERALKDAIEITFAFQGGEPTVAGLDYFTYFVAKVNEQKKQHIVHYTLQTNGLLLNEEWLDFFEKNDFLIGISLDGCESFHDEVRVQQGKGTFHRIMSNIQQLKKRSIQYNILTVLTAKMSSHAQEIYQFYKQQEFPYIQFIPCLPELDHSSDGYALSPHQFYQFYHDLFQLWYNDVHNGKAIPITLFDNLLLLFQGYPPTTCGLLGQCQIQMVIEADGSVYPCDFYALDIYKLGNINTHSFQDMRLQQKAKMFLNEKKRTTPLCQTCKFIKVCQGNCKRMNVTYFDDTYCGYQAFLEETYEKFYAIGKG